MLSPHRMRPEDCAVLVIDVQERLLPAVQHGKRVLESVELLIRSARRVGLPVLATEQYPQGLGPTCPTLVPYFSQTAETKTRFSAATPAIIDFLHRDARRMVVLAGMETHICVLQTALDLLAEDFAVTVVEDATASGRSSDHSIGLARMHQAGAVPASVEMAVFEWLGGAEHPAFKELAGAVRARRNQVE